MHLLISDATLPGPNCQAAVEQLALPNLTALLGLLTPTPPLAGSPETLTSLDAIRLTDLVERTKSGKAFQLRLCGERQAVTLELQEVSRWGRLPPRFIAASPQQLMNSL